MSSNDDRMVCVVFCVLSTDGPLLPRSVSLYFRYWIHLRKVIKVENPGIKYGIAVFISFVIKNHVYFLFPFNVVMALYILLSMKQVFEADSAVRGNVTSL